MDGTVDLAELVSLAEETARAAGALLLEGQTRQRSDIGTKTSGTDMVSEMDRAAEALIVERLLGARPGDSVLGEEGGERGEGTTGVRWVVDPLDGTTNYLYGHPRWSVSIAAEVGGAAAAGAIAEPSIGEMFTAVAGGGARLNGRPIRHSGQRDLATSLVGTGFAYLPGVRARQASALTHVLPNVRDVRRSGVASLDLCWVACGRLDGYYETNLQPWDIAAGVLVAAEAGALVSGVNGGPASADSVLAAAPGVAGALVALLAAAGPGP